jgi:DNA-binding transcriptional LysR family regulator
MQGQVAGPPLHWDDVQLFLALCRETSLGRAAGKLGVDASTVSRRLAALEERLALRLFDRVREGLRTTAAAERLLPSAEAMEAAAAGFSRDAESFEREVEGRVRITAPPGLSSAFVAPMLAELQGRHPRLAIDLDSSIGYADLARRDADLALRANRPRAGDLVAKKLLVAREVALGAPDYVASLGRLKRIADARWITYGDDLGSLATMRWLRQEAPGLSPVLKTSDFAAQARAAEAGLGLFVAPRPFVHAARVVEVALARPLAMSLASLPESELWLVGHRALRHVPRIAAVWSFLEEAFTRTPGPFAIGRAAAR